MVKDIYIGSTRGDIDDLIVFNNKLFFHAEDSTH
jgi:hypothetical protein